MRHNSFRNDEYRRFHPSFFGVAVKGIRSRANLMGKDRECAHNRPGLVKARVDDSPMRALVESSPESRAFRPRSFEATCHDDFRSQRSGRTTRVEGPLGWPRARASSVRPEGGPRGADRPGASENRNPRPKAATKCDASGPAECDRQNQNAHGCLHLRRPSRTRGRHGTTPHQNMPGAKLGDQQSVRTNDDNSPLLSSGRALEGADGSGVHP